MEACDDERGCLHVRQEIMQCSRAARCKPQGDHSTSLENQDHGLCGRDGRMWESWMQKMYVPFDKVVLVAWLDTQPTTKSVRRNSDTVLIRKPHSFLQARALSYWTGWLGFPACLLPHLSSRLFCTCLFDSRVSPSSLQSKQQLSS